MSVFSALLNNVRLFFNHTTIANIMLVDLLKKINLYPIIKDGLFIKLFPHSVQNNNSSDLNQHYYVDLNICKTVLHEYLLTTRSNSVTKFAIYSVYQKYVNATIVLLPGQAVVDNEGMPLVKPEDVYKTLLKNKLIDVETQSFCL